MIFGHVVLKGTTRHSLNAIEESKITGRFFSISGFIPEYVHINIVPFAGAYVMGIGTIF